MSAIDYRFPCAVEGALELCASKYTSPEIGSDNVLIELMLF